MQQHIPSKSGLRSITISKSDHGDKKLGHLTVVGPDRFAFVNWCSSDAFRALVTENAGGNSRRSEAMSIEYFVAFFQARDILLEKEVEYWFCSRMIDFLMTVRGRRVGVSVVRAMGYPNHTAFTLDKAISLLHKKIDGLIVARKCVSKRHSFQHSILHVQCPSWGVAKLIRLAWHLFVHSDLAGTVKGHLTCHITVMATSIIW